MPLLPFINDNKGNIKSIFKQAKDAGASYIIPMLGVTLRKGSREHFYKQLDQVWSGKKELYEQKFDICNNPDYNSLYSFINNLSQKYNLPLQMEFYNPIINQQLSIF